MTDAILAWLCHMRHHYKLVPGFVLEVGSYDENGSARYVFECGSAAYIGIDLRDDPGVDVLGDVRSLRGLKVCSFDTVICTEVIEHEKDPRGLVWRLRELLRPGGHLLLTSPHHEFPEHRYPRDYWRVMPDAYREILLDGMYVLDERIVGARFDQSHCWLVRNEPPPAPELKEETPCPTTPTPDSGSPAASSSAS